MLPDDDKKILETSSGGFWKTPEPKAPSTKVLVDAKCARSKIPSIRLSRIFSSISSSILPKRLRLGAAQEIMVRFLHSCSGNKVGSSVSDLKTVTSGRESFDYHRVHQFPDVEVKTLHKPTLSQAIVQVGTTAETFFLATLPFNTPPPGFVAEAKFKTVTPSFRL